MWDRNGSNDPYEIPIESPDWERSAADPQDGANGNDRRARGENSKAPRARPDDEAEGGHGEESQLTELEAARLRIAELEAKAAQMEDNWKRTAADLDNYRKRFQREVERARCGERQTILQEWLKVIDNLERALETEGQQDNPWRQGVEAIHQQMLEVLSCFGVLPFESRGDTFDPTCHEAVGTVCLPDEPEGKIVEVTERGYKVNGEILRPAKVIPVKNS